MQTLLRLLSLSIPLAAATPTLFASADSTPSGTQDSLQVEVTGPGKLYLGGNLIQAPWVLSYETGHITVNGYVTLRPKPPVAPTDPLQEARISYIQGVAAVMDSLNRTGMGRSKATSALREYCEKNTLGITVTAESTSVQLHAPGVGVVLFAPGLLNFPIGKVSPADYQSAKVRQFSELMMLKGCLERGGTVFFEDRNGFTVYPPGHLLESRDLDLIQHPYPIHKP